MLNRGLDHKQQEDTFLYDTHTPMNLLQKGAIALLSTAAAFRKKVVKLAKRLLLCLHKTEYRQQDVPAVLQEPIWLQLLERQQVAEWTAILSVCFWHLLQHLSELVCTSQEMQHCKACCAECRIVTLASRFCVTNLESQ